MEGNKSLKTTENGAYGISVLRWSNEEIKPSANSLCTWLPKREPVRNVPSDTFLLLKRKLGKMLKCGEINEGFSSKGKVSDFCLVKNVLIL